MEIILLESIRSLGKFGDVIAVKPGYGRNFLIPKGKALRATKANKEIFEERRALMEKENQERKAVAQKEIMKLLKAELLIVKQAGEDNKLYGSVTAREIADLLAQKFAIAISHEHVQLGGKLKEVGVFDVNIALHPEVDTQIKVSIARSEQEALDNIAKASLENIESASEKAAE
jgi:large subunit ribosomal protein L9